MASSGKRKRQALSPLGISAVVSLPQRLQRKVRVVVWSSVLWKMAGKLWETCSSASPPPQ